MKYTLVIECNSEEELQAVVSRLQNKQQPKSTVPDGIDLNDPRQLAEWVGVRKRELRYTNVALSRAMGVSVATIYNLLRPQPVSPETFAKLMAVLDPNVVASVASPKTNS